MRRSKRRERLDAAFEAMKVAYCRGEFGAFGGVVDLHARAVIEFVGSQIAADKIATKNRPPSVWTGVYA